jgi:type IV secretory pathway TrbF-like protein
MKVLPFFDYNGTRYEIKPTRHLLAEYDRLGETVNLSQEDKANGVKAQMLLEKVQKFATKLAEVEKRFFEDMSNEALEKEYTTCDKLYQKAVNELANLEAEFGSTQKLQKAGIDLLEQLVIVALKEQYSMSDKVAKETWCGYVDEIGKTTASEWLGAMAQVILQRESQEEAKDNDFLSLIRTQNSKKKK